MPTLFNTIYQEHLPYVTTLAKKFSRGDLDLADDLAQEAWLAVIQIPEARWPDSQYVRVVLIRAMYRYITREHAARVITLESRPCKADPPRRDVLQLRRNIPRPHIQAIPAVPPLNHRKAA
jgi:DNA-directed RNA polymerase specialized sigma24 family protein